MWKILVFLEIKYFVVNNVANINNQMGLILFIFYLPKLQKKPDWSKGKPGDAKLKEEAEGVEA